MKKYLFLTLIFLSAFPFFSMGTGGTINLNQEISYGSSYSDSFGASFSLKPDVIPFYLFLDTNYNPFVNQFETNFSFDYWFFNKNITSLWYWFSGAGAGTGFSLKDGDYILTFGPRFVIGTNWILFDGFLEIFMQEALQQNAAFVFGDKNGIYYPLSLPFSVGIRIWD